MNRTNRCFPSLLQLSPLTDSATHRAYSTLSVDSPSQRYPSTLDLSRTDGLTVPSLQPLALAALQLTTHLQLSSKAGSSSFSFYCRVASSSAALPQILFKPSNSRYQLDAASKATVFVLCFSDSN
ncbi:hypothetical protein SLEP1_g35795 [Rubroshorea leprosula]|uniref:Uncharacterized protein n=1 Tax=Rubroshorea leprosula TaxID=152421 RepID=A0AAV5KPE5_9ROSI|nr:hypothetical protein SLEP1_g35795 [Rubroshorea leprosula]